MMKMNLKVIVLCFLFVLKLTTNNAVDALSLSSSPFKSSIDFLFNKRTLNLDDLISEHSKKYAQSLDTQYFNQRLDHFNDTGQSTWQQRYWVNDQYFDQTNGPVFLFISGEDQASPSFVVSGLMAQYASEKNALCVILEHRFYGKSQPTGDLSTQSLGKYLNKDQALEDLAAFRNFIHNQFNLSSSRNRWVSFGGSYPGCLSAWFRLKRPDLIYAAYSASAPIRIKANFKEYLEVVSESLSIFNDQCPDEIRKATDKFQLLSKTANGRQTLQTIFNTCGDLENPDDLRVLQLYIQSVWKNSVQSSPASKPTIKKLCSIMTNKTEPDPLQKLLRSLNEALITSTQCLNVDYKVLIDGYKNDQLDDSGDAWARQWLYQSCFEFGYFQTTDSAEQPFGAAFTLDFNYQMCRDVFGDAFNASQLSEKVLETNQAFGGDGNYKGTRVVFTNGQVDPWSALGFTGAPPNQQTKTIFIQGTSHCADFYGFNERNPVSLNNAIFKAKSYLNSWLK